MRPAALTRRRSARALAALLALCLCASALASLAWGERIQRGNLIAALDGSLSPLQLPRDRPAPISIHLEGGLSTEGGALLPRVTRLELGLPGQGVLTTRGLPACSVRLLRDAVPRRARSVCGQALVGHGELQAQVVLPNQTPFTVRSGMLAFNGRVGGKQAVLLHVFSADPPTVDVLPFVRRSGSGLFPTSLVADLPASLGPWPRFAHFEITLSRRYEYQGRSYSYLGASCPVPRSVTAAYFSLARASFTLAGGRQISIEIARGCRASKS